MDNRLRRTDGVGADWVVGDASDCDDIDDTVARVNRRNTAGVINALREEGTHRVIGRRSCETGEGQDALIVEHLEGEGVHVGVSTRLNGDGNALVLVDFQIVDLHL